MLLRYRALIHRYRPDFSIDEWRLIVGAFAGMPTEYETSLLGATPPDPKQVLSRAVHATALEGAETAIGVDRLRLLGRIGNLNDAEAAAVIDVVERFWSGAPKDDLAAVPEAIQRILAAPYS